MHKEQIRGNAIRAMEFIKRQTSNFNNITCILKLDCACVRSTLEYCSVAWCPGYVVYATHIKKSVDLNCIR